MDKIIVIDNLHFPVLKKSDNPDEKGRIEEDGYSAATALDMFKSWWGHTNVNMLVERRGLKTWQEWVMFALPHIAKFYNVDRKLVMKEWTRSYAVPELWSVDEIGD